ncbi:MAG: ABC transporter ATP-binding protein [Planctomycetota bacterium]|jgi:ABC-2 type transport system ATP-binding protein
MTLCTKGLTKRFGKNAVLTGVDFEAREGAVTVLLGRNGAGKSTLMKLALGVLRADEGELSVCGLDPVTKPRDVRRLVGYVPDKPDVYNWMTPRDLYRFLKPQYPGWSDENARRYAEELDVPLKRTFKALSRGEGMKAMLVAALAIRPKLLLLDEPFAGLDAIVREEVLRGVIDALSGLTVLCTTHDLDVASRIADHIALLDKGSITMHEHDNRAPVELKELLAC